MRTFFIDLDGTLLKKHDDKSGMQQWITFDPLPHALENLKQLAYEGAHVVLATGRPPELRALVIERLRMLGWTDLYHELVMGLGDEERVIVNDTRLMQKPRARAISVVTNHRWEPS